jgi:SagB-type dehydrogenase family enzyme
MKVVSKLLVALLALVMLSCNNTKTTETVGVLPEPQISGGKPLMLALRDRRTGRDFSDKELSMQQISNLLWAANGINRPAEKRHTAPTAMNKQELEIYVAMKSGVYFFDADNQQLSKVLDTDIRAQIGSQQFHKIAPVNLLIVADLDKVFGNDTTKVYDALDAGYISQNIYLYCASEDLATVAVAMVNRDQVADLLHFTNRKKIILAHPVGFKKE